MYKNNYYTQLPVKRQPGELKNKICRRPNIIQTTSSYEHKINTNFVNIAISRLPLICGTGELEIHFGLWVVVKPQTKQSIDEWRQNMRRIQEENAGVPSTRPTEPPAPSACKRTWTG